MLFLKFLIVVSIVFQSCVVRQIGRSMVFVYDCFILRVAFVKLPFLYFRFRFVFQNGLGLKESFGFSPGATIVFVFARVQHSF